MASLDELASRYHDRLKSIKDRTRLANGDWYPWRSLAAIQMLEQRMGIDADELQRMIGSQPVLDVGCGDGDIAFFLESVGAKVDAVDHPLSNYNRMEGVRALKDSLGSKIGIHAIDLDARPNLPGSNYGFAILLGVLYHLKNPYLALEALAKNSRWLYMSTRIATQTPDKQLRFGAYPMAYLVDERELNDDPTNFWIFSEEGLKRLVRRAGWSIFKEFTTGPAESDPVSEQGDARMYLLLQSTLAVSSGLTPGDGWYELSYAARWTGPKFSASLNLEEPLKAATLRFVFQIPDALAAQRPVTVLQARVNGAPMQSAEFRGSGEHEYIAVAGSLPAGIVNLEFEVNAGTKIGADERELGVQVYFNGPPPIQLK